MPGHSRRSGIVVSVRPCTGIRRREIQARHLIRWQRVAESQVQRKSRSRIVAIHEQVLAPSPASRQVVEPVAVAALHSLELGRQNRDPVQQPKARRAAKRIASFTFERCRQPHVRHVILQLKADRHASATRRLRLDANQLEELALVAIGHAVELVAVHLRDPREQLHQRDAGIVKIVVGPLGRVERNERATFFDQVRPAPIVEIGKRQRHTTRTLLRPEAA